MKAQFPALQQTVHGKPLIYLDSAASSQKPQCVIDAISYYYEHDHANVHRGAYELSIRATHQYEEARGKVARFLGAPRHEEIVFTKGTTEGINLVASAWGRANLKAGDAIVVTEMEHHSNLVPWHLVAGATGAEIRAVRLTDDGQLDLDSLDDCLRDGKARIVAFQHVSNALGTIHPVEEITRRSKEAGAVVLIDGAQAAPQMPVDVRAIGCDFYAISGHKMCGPTGIGALWGRRELLEAMPPYQGGGEMIDQVWVDRSTYRKPPQKFEAGTPPIAGAIGLGVAVEFLTEIGMERIHEHEKRLARLTLQLLRAEFENIRVYGPVQEISRAGVISFNLADIHPHDLATILDHEAIAIRAGHHCCQPLMRRFAITSTARCSLYLYNNVVDLNRLVGGLQSAGMVFETGSTKL
ncbi:MAG TPA: SufS family cysteine desulfurase [Gemmatimonadota bacterium]|nr:SufS family cysteine desulfurase [Gemmatimonadota bacterium]